MTNATDTTDGLAANASSDPISPLANDLQALLPRRSKLRVVVWSLVFLLALAGAWVAPKALAPEVQLGDAAAQQYFPDAPYVWAAAPITVHGWPSATVVAVGDRPGAKAIAAWLTTEEQAQPFMAGNPGTALSQFTAATGMSADQLHAIPPGVWVYAETNLLVLWQITDCDQVIAAQDTVPTTLTVQTAWGIKRQVSLGQAPSQIDPSAMHDREGLDQLGVCP